MKVHKKIDKIQTRLLHTTINTMLNTCIYLINKQGYVMMLRCRATRMWMTPGGKLERGESTWQGMLREFEEETNTALSTKECSLLHKAWWRDTCVYVVLLKYRLPNRFRATNETTERRFIHYTQLVANPRVKSYVKKSFEALDVSQIIKSFQCTITNP